MKKRKTYEISIIDKTYSKIISDETKFYTSDTALELVFKLKETEYNFESAEIVLLNIDDRSLVTRPVSKVNNDFVYELDDDIIPHYGEWHGQLRFEAGEIYVSSPVKFRIENDLGNERPPQLSDVQSWVSLKRYADSLIEELKQAVLSVEGIEDTVNANETARQAQELEREKSESQRQSSFETNETERQTTFETAELSREQAEMQRDAAESIRVSNEEQRKIDHANISAELDGKANKKQEDWITPTLINSWDQHPSYDEVGYYKDDFGVVHLRGSVVGGEARANIFILPSGYRPSKFAFYPVLLSASGSTFGSIYVDSNGAVYSYQTGISLSLNHISFRAER